METELIEIENYILLHVKTNPSHLEAKIMMDREDISQKLLFTLMEISHRNGFACSAPHFGVPDNDKMTFLIGTTLPTKKYSSKYGKRLVECLAEINEFLDEFYNQLDFSVIDVSMFGGLEFNSLDFSHLAAIRDQSFNGSWRKFKNAVKKQGHDSEIIDKCVKFEKLNNKDLGFVGHKLKEILTIIDGPYVMDSIN